MQKKVIIGILVVMAVLLTIGLFPVHGEAKIYDSVVRLHVLANSDSDADQALKLRVRDAVLTRATVYNGWRHFYFLYAGFAVLAAWGLETLQRRAEGLNGAAIAGILALCMAAEGVGILQNHPYQYAYYNFLAPADAEETMELDYWDVSTVNALRLLLGSERNEALPLTVSGTDALSHLGLEQALSALTAEEKALLTVTNRQEDASYLWMNTTYGRIYGATVPRNWRVLLEIRSYGHTICTVYERMEKGTWRD